MIITKRQLALLCKWAKSGRLIVRPVLGAAVPEWAAHEFRLARICVDVMRDGMKWRDERDAKVAKRDASREALLSVLAKIEAKSKPLPKSYSAGSRKGWVTRKRQDRARAAAAENVGKEGSLNV